MVIAWNSLTIFLPDFHRRLTVYLNMRRGGMSYALVLISYCTLRCDNKANFGGFLSPLSASVT